MKAQLVIEGLDELRAELRRMPDHLVMEAAAILTGHGTKAAEQIRDAYPEVTGRLKRGVRADRAETARGGASVRVISAAPHAHLYEFGTARGGRPHPTFVPIIQRTRLDVFRDQVALVRREGFQVSGAVA